jgi:hypothetical protein
MPQNLDFNPKRLTVSELIVSATEGNILVQTEAALGAINLQSSSIDLNSNSAFLSLNESANGGGIVLGTTGAEGAILVQATSEDVVSALTVTPAGMMMAYGMPGMIGAIQINKGEMVISMGEPEVGPTITITSDSISFQVGETIMSMTADGIVTTAPSVEINCDDTNLLLSSEGITEEVGEVSREVSAEGHNLTAGEVEMNVGVAGITSEAPTSTGEFEGSAELNSPMLTQAVDAMLSIDSAITMVE